MSDITVATQAELDEAIAKAKGAKGTPPKIILIGDQWFRVSGSAHVVARESAHVEARGSAHVVARGSAHVEARGSAHVEARGSAHVEARGSAHVEAWGSAHVEARESAHVEAWESAHVEARGSAHVEARGSAHVVARESAHVVAWESAHVEASPYVAVTKQLGHTGQIVGGVVIAIPQPKTAADWCAFYGVTVNDGVALLYKGVRDDYRSSHGLLYAPGSVPVAPDWDGGREECGGGLHFSFHAAATLNFDREATKFLACPVALKDIRAPIEGDGHPGKVKARGLCAPCYEVDRTGAAVGAKS